MTDFWRRRLHLDNGESIQIAFLIRPEDWRPLEAPWWHGKEVSIIGADISGNFFLRHCDGSVRHWTHELQADEIMADSVVEFCKRIA